MSVEKCTRASGFSGRTLRTMLSGTTQTNKKSPGFLKNHHPHLSGPPKRKAFETAEVFEWFGDLFQRSCHQGVSVFFFKWLFGRLQGVGKGINNFKWGCFWYFQSILLLMLFFGGLLWGLTLRALWMNFMLF